MALAGAYDIVTDQGATYSQVFTWNDSDGDAVSLVGWTGRMQVRTRVPTASTVLELTTSNGRMTLGGVAGTVTVTVTAADMANVAAGAYMYDLELVNGSVVERLVMGSFTVRGEVTR
jgi:hypothetical protein